MASIFDIDKRIYEVINQGFYADPETGEVWQGQEGLDALQMGRRDKIEGVALWLKEQEHLAESMRAEEDTLRCRRTALERRCESIRGYLASAVADEPKRTFETPRVRLRLRKVTAVQVDDPELVPDECTYVTETRHIDKSAAKKLLNEGRKVPGCRLVERDCLGVA